MNSWALAWLHLVIKVLRLLERQDVGMVGHMRSLLPLQSQAHVLEEVPVLLQISTLDPECKSNLFHFVPSESLHLVEVPAVCCRIIQDLAAAFIENYPFKT